MPARTLILAAAALAASGAAILPAAAAPEAGKMPFRATVMFNLVDRNGDGSIDKDELDAVRNAIFAAIDKNGDGKLSKDEIQAVGEGMRDRAQQFQHRPRFGWQGGPPAWRGPTDDRRGPMMDDRRGPRGDRQGQMDDRRGPPQGGMMGRMGFDSTDNGAAGGPQTFAAVDTNGDGSVSQDEFSAGQTALLPGLSELLTR